MDKRRKFSAPTSRQKFTLRLLIFTGVLSSMFFAYHLLGEEVAGHPLLYAMLLTMVAYYLAKRFSLWYHYLNISVPEKPANKSSFTVDVLTTYYPGEPYEMVEQTLLAIKAITYPHTTYLCDEANAPRLVAFCERNDIIHVTRDNRINAKAGNINNALKQATGEICLILDPDHIPFPDFIDQVVPHFSDPKIGFVQVVQSYHNKFETLVTKGAAQQTYHFYGPVMMTMNSYGTVNAIGANCTFRRAALDSIGGHAPGLAEDLHTAMLLYNKGWRSVYVPSIVARGQVPSTLFAYYKQQMKWALGTFELLFFLYPKIFLNLTARQRIHYALALIHYLSGFSYLLGFLIPILSLFLCDTPWKGAFTYFLLIYAPVLFSSMVIRYYVQNWLIEEDEHGFHIVGGLLELITWWIYILGFIYSLLRIKVPYLPTPKGNEDKLPARLLLPNLTLAGLSLAAIAYGLPRDLTPFSIAMAIFCLINATLLSFSVVVALRPTNRIGHLRKGLNGTLRKFLGWGKFLLLKLLNGVTIFIRSAPIPIILLFTLLPIWAAFARQDLDWEKADELRSQADVHSTLSTPCFPGTTAPEQAWSTDSANLEQTRRVIDSVLTARSKVYGLAQSSVKNLRAINYRKIENWSGSRYDLTRQPILQDFNEIADLGLNAVVVRPPGIYQHNTILLSQTAGIGLLLKVSLSDAEMELEEADWMNKLSEVEDLAADFAAEANFIGFTIDFTDCSPSVESSTNTARPRLSKSQVYRINDLVEAIRRSTNRHAILLSLNAGVLCQSIFWESDLSLLTVDLLALRVESKSTLIRCRQLGLLGHPEIVLTHVSPEVVSELSETIGEQAYVLNNFQNTWQAGTISLDGLLDFEGRRQLGSSVLSTPAVAISGIPVPTIMTPGINLTIGKTAAYHVMLYRDGEWNYGAGLEEKLGISYEWRLIKKSSTGAYLAFRELPPGPVLTLQVPADYQRYELLLTVTDGYWSRSVRSNIKNR